MKKSLLLTLVATVLFIGCSTDPEDGPQGIVIPGKMKNVTIESSSSLTCRIEFTAAQAWHAEVNVPNGERPWLSVDPISGPAGSNTITLTADENTSDKPRSATIVISCPDGKAGITVTQQGAGAQPEPETPYVPVEDRLTLIEYTHTNLEPTVTGSSSEPVTTVESGYVVVTYDQDGQLSFLGDYLFDGDRGEQNDLEYLNELRLDRSEKGIINVRERYAEIYEPYVTPGVNDSNYPTLYSEDTEQTVTLDAAARFKKIESEVRVDEYAYLYNPDGTLKQVTYWDHSMRTVDEYTWQYGDLQVVKTSYENEASPEESRYTYSEHPNPWHGVDVGSIATGIEWQRLSGMTGMRSKHLPASCQYSYDSESERYAYTFDANGRIETITCDATFGTTVYKLYYGTQAERHYDFAKHLVRQEITGEKVEWGDDLYAYASVVEMRSTFSDGSTADDRIARQVRIEYRGEPAWTAVSIPHGSDLSSVRVQSVSLESTGQAPMVVREYRYTLDYGVFRTTLSCSHTLPTCSIYDTATKNYEMHEMKTAPITEQSFRYDDPSVSVENDNYYFQHRVWLYVKPGIVSWPEPTWTIQHTLVSE